MALPVDRAADDNVVVTTSAALPYGPILQRILRPLQRAFLPFNRWVVGPMLRSRLWRFVGNPSTGYLLLLRTRGRRSGVIREAPVGYVIRDGAVYVVAGYGAATPWFLNLLAEPLVEIRLPGRTIRARAHVVTDDAEWLAAFRALMRSFGLVGRLVDGDVERDDDATVLARNRMLPVVRLTAVEGGGAVSAGPIVAGPWDPGGRGWAVAYLGLAGVVGSIVAAVRARRSDVRAT